MELDESKCKRDGGGLEGQRGSRMKSDEVTATEGGLQDSTMHYRQITLPDGRYLIFYTFESEAADPVDEHDQGEDV